MLFIESLLCIISVWVLAFFKAPRIIWTTALTVVLLWVTWEGNFSIWACVPLWLLFLVVASIFNFPLLRLRFFTPRVLTYFQSVLPPLTQSEKEALAAGDVWWEGDLFAGNPSWNKLASLAKPSMSAEEQAFLDNQVETLCAMIDDWQIMREQCLPPEVWEYIKKEGFLGLVIDKAYGGKGFSPLAHSNIVTKISSRSPSVGIAVMVPNALGTGEFISHYGTSEQKGYYLPRLARGQEIPAFGLTSTEAGSDASSITDTGIVCYGEFKGQKVLGLRLNWDKRYITLAPVATLLGLAIKMYDPEHLLGQEEDLGITLCLLPTDLPGVEIGARHFPAGLGFVNGPTRGCDVFIPLSFIIGGAEMRGKGWHMMMEALAGGRGISLPALTTAAAKLCYRMTGAYARIREQFHLPIGQLEGVGEVLGRMGGLTYLCEAARNFTISSMQGGVKPALAAAITKYHVTEMSRKIVNDAMDVHGGRGVQLGPRNYLGSVYQAAPISITVEGANILTRCMMIFGQGAMRCHPFIKAELAALTAEEPLQRLQQFDKLFCQHLGVAVRHFARVLFYGLTGGRFIAAPASPDKKIRKYCRQLTRMSAAFALSTEGVLAVLGGQLKRQEALSARLGDVLSYLYLASAVLKYYQDQGQFAEDLPFVYWTLEYCLSQIQTAFNGLWKNFTPRWIASILKKIIFPWGQAYLPPSDVYTQQIAAAMMTNSAQRDRLTAYCYLGAAADDPTGRMEQVLLAAEKAEIGRAKLHDAMHNRKISRKGDLRQKIAAAKDAGILTEDEVNSLEQFVMQQWDAVQVDVFDSSLVL